MLIFIIFFFRRLLTKNKQKNHITRQLIKEPKQRESIQKKKKVKTVNSLFIF